MHQHTPHPHDLEQALGSLYDTPQPPEAFETGWRAAVRREETLKMSNQNSKKNIWRVVAPVAAALVLVVGTLVTGDMDLTTAGTQPVREESRVLAMGSAASGASTSGTSNALYKTAETADMAVYDESAAAYDGGVAADTALPAAEERKLVRTASLTIRTSAFESDLALVQQLAQQAGGYVSDLYQYGDVQNGRDRSASISLRIPADKLDEFLSGIEGVGRVTDRSESVTDMTLQYTDNAARLETLRGKKARLDELLLKAEDVSDLIEIESAIADTVYQIESYERIQRDIDRRVEMSDVYVSLMEETPADSAADTEMGLGQRMAAGLRASLEGLGGFLRDMLVFVVMCLPVLIPVAVIAVVVWLVVRRRKRRKEDSE